MKDIKVHSVTIEVTHPGGGATLVIREPQDAAQRVYVAGHLPAEVAERVVRELGLDVALAPASAAGGAPPSSRRATPPLDVVSELASSAADSTPADTAQLLEELASAVLRAGRLQPTSTVDELLGRAWAHVRGRVSVARALARLEEGLAPDAPPALAALALATLAELALALRAESGELRLELQAKSEPFEPATLIEVGRHRERGAVGWETRLLLETTSGTLYREEGPLRERRLSRGPVGRIVSVTLGRRLQGLSPSRLQILQYEYEPAAPSSVLEQATAFASPSLPRISPSGLELVAVPRPAWLAVDGLTLQPESPWLETGEAEVALADGPLGGILAALRERMDAGLRPRALAGSLEHRVDGADTRLVFVPWAGLFEDQGALGLHAFGF